MQHKDNNLNLLRLVAALFVLYAHSFAFYGNSPKGFLGLESYGGLGVNIFFIISGYLIVKSWDANPDFIDFMVKRSLRIFPALIVLVLITMFLLGPIFTTLNLREYFEHPQFTSYFKNIVLSPVFYLPGVLENVRIANAVNGSLWSLPVEFFMYLVVLFIGVFFKSNRLVYAALVCVFISVIYFWCWKGADAIVIYGTDVRQIFLTGVYFLIGACCAKWKLERKFTLSGVCVLMMLTILIAPYQLFAKYILWFALPYIVLAYGLSTSRLGSLMNRTGDCSYGVYIYAFPVQQFMLLVYPSISYAWYLIVTSVITIFLGYCSWHFIEKHALKLKPKDKRSVSIDMQPSPSSSIAVKDSTKLLG